jgi:hypothetical protein
MLINVPPNGPSHVYGKDGAAYMSKMIDGRLVIDVPPDIFRSLLCSRQGKDWEDANAGGDAWRYLTPGAHC